MRSRRIRADNDQSHGSSIHYTYGLHRRCSNTNTPPSSSDLYTPSTALYCVQFPRYNDCRGDDRYFCSMWRSVGFLMSFAVVLEGMTIAAFAVLLIGGKQKREQGWGVLTILVALAALVQAVGMALMVGLTLSSVQQGSDRVDRHTCTKTTSAFSPGGIWTRVGPCARFPGVSRHYARLPSPSQQWFSRVKEVTN